MPELRQGLSAKKVFVLLTGIAAGLVAVHLLIFAVSPHIRFSLWPAIIDRFDLDQEDNIPTVYSTFLLLIAAAYAFVIARHTAKSQQKYPKHWYAISALLLYMSVDEGASIHETANAWASRLFGSGVHLGLIIFRGWTEPALVLVAIVALSFYRFALQLPARTKYTLMTASIVYVFAAVVVESATYTAFHWSPTSFAWHVEVAVEEGLEMLGVCLAIYGLADYAQKHVKTIELKFTE